MKKKDIEEKHLNIKKHYDYRSKEYDYYRTKGYFDFVNKEEVKIVNYYIKNFKKCKILEIGCGTGILMSKIKKNYKDINIKGVDISEDMLKKAREKKLSVEKSDALHLPYRNNTFDIVYLFKVAPHIKEIKEAVKEFDRVLKHKGILIIEFYNIFSIKFFTYFLRELFKKPDVFIKYYTINQIKKYFIHTKLKLKKIYGIRIFTLSPMFKLGNIFSKLISLLEQKLQKIWFKYLAGFLIFVYNKRD